MPALRSCFGRSQGKSVAISKPTHPTELHSQNFLSSNLLSVLLSALRNPAPLESRPYAPASGVRREKALLFLNLLTQLSYIAKTFYLRTYCLCSFLRYAILLRLKAGPTLLLRAFAGKKRCFF